MFDLPEKRGIITISDVLAEPPGNKRDEKIYDWCKSVWEAYSESHKQVADLVQEELR